MNAQITINPPLSPALLSPLSASGNHPARRHLVGDFLIQLEALAHFNQLLEKLNHFPLEPDQLATASRELAAPGRTDRSAPVLARLQLVDSVDRMIRDRGWQPADPAVAAARVVVGYLHDGQHLIPRSLPRVGRLDEAILIDAAWPQLAGEMDCYGDYCRLRAIEASLRGRAVGDFAFSRDDWQQARSAEAGLTAHCRRVGQSSYLPAPGPAGFRVY